MTSRSRTRRAVVSAVALALLLPAQALAAEGDPHGGGDAGGGGDTTGSLYADLVVALRAEDGTPILKKYVVPAPTETEATTEYCVQPAAYEGVPGVTATTNPVDGRQVWPLPLQGEWLPGGTREGDPTALPVDEIGACDAIPQYAMFVSEAELERLNLARTSDQVIADKLAAVETKLKVADAITLDGAGRIATDGLSLDASPEFAAMYQSLMKTGTLPGLPSALAGPPAHVGIFDAWKLAAAAIGTAASKEVPITVDTVEYYNRVIGFPGADDYTSPWGVNFLRSDDPDNPGTPMATGERFVDFSGFSYNRSETFVGSVTWLDVPNLKWNVSRIADVVDFNDLSGDPIGTRTLHGAIAFAQLADDVRSVIWYYHEHETIPGFYIDPVGVDTTAAQLKAITDPAVDLGTLPADVFQTVAFQVTASLFNPWGGTTIDHARLRLTVDAPTDLTASDVTATAVADGQSMPFTASGGNLAGWWGPDGGFDVAPGYHVPSTFDVTVADGAATGDYNLRLELVDLDTNETLAEDNGVLTVNDNAPTVLWAAAPSRLVVQDTPFKVPVTVYSPAAGEADLTFALTGPGDDPTTDLIEELKAGDAKAYASNGTDMVAMPLSLEGGRLVGTWHTTLAPGYNPVTWYVTIVSGAITGNYALDVGLVGGNDVDTATVVVSAPEEHGQQPPDAGDDTTAPVVTITVVGTLSTDASFTLSANESDVTYVVRLVKDDVPGAWEPATAAGKTYTGLTPGIYAFHVKATDAAGNVSGMYSKTWVVAPEPDSQQAVPNTSFVRGPANGSWLLARSTEFQVASSAGAAFIVTVNGKYVGTSATGRVVVSGLRSGSNRITMRAIVGGLADPTPVVQVVNVPRGVRSLAHSGAWTMRHGAQYLFGSYAVTRRYGQAFRLRSPAIKRIALVVSEGVRNGKVRVYLNGKPISRTIDLGASANRTEVLIPVRTFRALHHGLITVKVVSRGKPVRLEGIGVATG